MSNKREEIAYSSVALHNTMLNSTQNLPPPLNPPKPVPSPKTSSLVPSGVGVVGGEADKPGNRAVVAVVAEVVSVDGLRRRQIS